MNSFTSIELTNDTLDIYHIRTAIMRALQENMIHFNGRLIDIGCGKMPYREHILKGSAVTQYVGLDIEGAIIYDATVRPDHTWDGITMPFENSSFDTAFATEVLEHCPDPQLTLSEVSRVLKPGGAFFFTVPFLWNLHEVPHDEYRFTPFALQRLLTGAGFTKIELEGHGGWNASLAQMLGLWLNRSGLSPGRKKMYTALLKPVISSLLKNDKAVKTFRNRQMITGLSGIAYKAG